ncbi:hypothetical protein OAI26_02570 [Sulfitobacter sp.]|nr:hypothetical protein [Sulfitobacter sp.]
MARPKIDTEELTSRLVAEAERMLVETQGRRLVLSELAARVGISQSYAHRFFPTKADLLRTLAKRWFAEVEAESMRITALDLPAPERLETWILTILRLKRDKFDENQALYLAYLDLALGHMDLVKAHTDLLTRDLASIVSGIVGKDRLADALALVEDATLLFRTPQNIARLRERATDERARAVVKMCLDHLT